MAIKVSITTLKAAIGKAQQKAEDAQAGETESRILDSQIRAANARVESAESAVTRSEMTKKEAEDKLSPPPTKQITSDGKKGGTKTVVDEREKDKLQAQVRAADVQIQQAQSAVEDSRAEAEKLTSQALDGAGVSDEQQMAMAQLSDLMSELKTAAEDGSTDLEGDEFQTKLQDAVAQSDALAEELPDDSNEALNDFWEGISEGFELIEDKITKATGATPYEIEAGDAAANYAQFFTDFNQEAGSLITKLEDQGEIDPLLRAELQREQIKLFSNSDQFFALNADDKEKLEELMTGIREIDNKLTRGSELTGEITDDDISGLIRGMKSVGALLARGGSNFEISLEAQFNGIADSLVSTEPGVGSIRSELIERGQTGQIDALDALQGKLRGIANPENFIGLSKEDYDAIAQKKEEFLQVFRDLVDGNEVTDEQLGSLFTATSDLADQLQDRYQITAQSSTNNGSSSGPVRSSSNHNGAPSYATTGF